MLVEYDTEFMAAALRESAQQVLELMYFLSAEPAQRDAIPEHAAAGILEIFAQVEFQGVWKGRLIVAMPETLAFTMAGNFSGALDEPGVGAGIMIESICEFANMICGNTITRLGCPGIVTLSPPHLIEEWPEEQPLASERWLDTGEGLVRVSLELEAAA